MSIESRVMMTRVRALGTLLDIEKAAKAGGKFNSAKHPRYPAGNPKGGQFRPKLGMGSGGAEIFMPVYTGSNKIIQSFEAATLAVANQMAQGVMSGAQKLMGMKTHPDDTNNTKLKSTVRQLAAGVAKPEVTPVTAAITAAIAAPNRAGSANPFINRPHSKFFPPPSATDNPHHKVGQDVFNETVGKIAIDAHLAELVDLPAVNTTIGGLMKTAEGRKGLEKILTYTGSVKAKEVRDAIFNQLASETGVGKAVKVNNKVPGNKAMLAAEKHIVSISKNLPKKWINEDVGLDQHKGKTRASYSPDRISIMLGNNHVSHNKMSPTHEFIHHIQHTNFGINAVFAMEHHRRTASEPMHIFNGSERTKPDRYFSAYLGREYGFTSGVHGVKVGSAKEVMSVAMEGLLEKSGSLQGNRSLAKVVTRDPVMFMTALGALYGHRVKETPEQTEARAKAYLKTTPPKITDMATDLPGIVAKPDAVPGVAVTSTPVGTHPQLDTNGKPVTIKTPTTPSDPATWNNASAMAVFTPHGDAPDSLNGVAFTEFKAPKDAAGWQALADQNKITEPDTAGVAGAGVLIREPDGRVWAVEPTNHFGGYDNSFPKGGKEAGMDLQATALKETFEESGLQVKLTVVLGDYKGTTGTTARYYLAERIGGTPKAMGWETQSVKLVPESVLGTIMNQPRDQKIAADLAAKGKADATAVVAPKPADTAPVAAKVEPTPAVAPKVDTTPVAVPTPVATPATAAAGAIGDPPKIASASNPAYQKKIDGLYASVKAGDTGALDAFIPLQQAKVDAAKLKPTLNAHDKWNAQLLTAAVELKAKATGAKIDATVTAATTPAPVAVKPAPAPVAASAVPVKPDTTGDWSATGQIKTIDKIVTGDGNGYKKENAIPTLNNYLLSSLITPQAKQYAQAWIDHLSAQGKTSPVATAKPTPAPVVTATATAAVISAPKGIGSKAHQQYTKQGDAVYQAALAGDKATVDGFVAQYQAKIDAAKLKPNYPTFADGQYNKLLAYSQKVQAEMQTAATAGLPATSPKSALTKTKLTLAEMTQVGGKPGGSNPGGIYQDADGAKWLVKGSNKPDPDGGPARNEVLASRLYNAAGGFAPEMRTVDMGAQYGGGIGVASKMQDGFTKLDANNPAHIAKVREDFAMDAWLANWDAVGMDFDNTVIDKNGNAMRIDPGGALLYRAQGEPKGADFGKTVNEWDGMRDPSKNPQAAKIFAGMTDSELKASAAKVAAIPDSTIQTLVNRYGPGDAAAKAALADTLIARKQDVIAKAGMIGATTTAVVSTVAVAPAAGAGFKLDAGTVQGMANKTANQVEALANGKLTLANLTDAQFNRIADGLTAMDTAEINAWGQAVIGDKFKALPGTATIDIPSKAEATALLTNMANADAFAAPATTPASASTPPVKPDLTGLADSDKTLIGVIENLATKSDPIYASMTDTQIKETLGGFATTKNASLMSPAVTQYAQAWLDHLNAGGTATATATPATVTPTATIKPALPNFNAAKLASTNSNAPGINAKIDKIASLANAGDVNGLLALNYGSNTYAKKTVALANDALAALGSTEKVVAGQKANTHPAIGTATVAKTPPVKPVVATGEKGLVDLIETVATGKGAIKDPDEIVKNLALKASWGGDAGKYAEAWLDHMGYTHDGIGNATPKTATAATPTSTPGSLTGAFKSTPAAPVAKTPAQTLAADIKALATKLKDADADGGINTFKQQLDIYSLADPGFIKTYLGIAAKSKDYSPEVNAFAQKALDMPDGVNALITAWNAPDGTTATPVAGAWGNQYGAGIDGVTTRVTALGMAAAKPGLDPAKLEPPADYNNFNGPGKGLSSSAAKNDASNKIAQELYTLAANGDMVALKAYDVDSKTTSSQTKDVVGAYKNQLVGQIENMLNPPPPVATWKIGGKVSAENVTAALTTAFPKHKQYQGIFAEKSNMLGRWGVLGGLESKSFSKVVTAADGIPPIKLGKSSPDLQKIYDDSMAKFNALTDVEQKAINSYTGGIYTTWNTQIATNKLGSDVKVGITAYEKASAELPPGLILSRKWSPPSTKYADIMKNLINMEGKVVQDVAMISTSINPTVWDGAVRMRIKTLPGARGLYVSNTSKSAEVIGNHPNEQEIVLNSKTRFLVTKVSYDNYDKDYFKNGGDVFMDVLALPEDPAGSVLDSMGGVN